MPTQTDRWWQLITISRTIIPIRDWLFLQSWSVDPTSAVSSARHLMTADDSHLMNNTRNRLSFSSHLGQWPGVIYMSDVCLSVLLLAYVWWFRWCHDFLSQLGCQCECTWARGRRRRRSYIRRCQFLKFNVRNIWDSFQFKVTGFRSTWCLYLSRFSWHGYLHPGWLVGWFISVWPRPV